MLRTMITDTPFEQKWVLQGRLCNRWAADLKERWETSRATREGRKCTVNLEDVISVDTQGEQVLLEMVSGATLFALRAYMKPYETNIGVAARAAESSVKSAIVNRLPASVALSCVSLSFVPLNFVFQSSWVRDLLRSFNNWQVRRDLKVHK